MALGAIAVLAGAGMLSPVGYISLLAGSSLLHAWGMAGEYALVAEVPPSRHRVAGNALLGATAQITIENEDVSYKFGIEGQFRADWAQGSSASKCFSERKRNHRD